MKDNEIGSFLFLTGKSYLRLMGHLHREENEKASKEREKAHKKYLKKQSDEMAEKWPDSIQNIKNREKERREMKEQLREEIQTGQSEYYKEFHRKEREKFLADIRNKMKMKRAPNLSLSNALMESYVRAENKAFIKHKNEIRLEEEENEAKWVELVHKTVSDFKQNEEEEKCKARERTKMVHAYQLKQIQEKQKNDLQAKANKLEEEQEDLRKLEQEIKERKNNESQDFENRKKGMKKYMLSQSQRKERERNVHETEEAEMTEVCNMYNEFNTNRSCRIEKQKKQELKNANAARRKLGLSNKQIDDNKEVKEHKIWLNQHMEQERRYHRARADEAKKREKMQEEMNTFYSTRKMKTQKKENEKSELFRYKLAERLKDAEEIRKYEEEKEKRIRESEIEFTKEWEKQIDSKREMIDKKTVEKRQKSIFEIEDEKFLAYAKDCLDHIRSKGMDDYPIRREINKYCKNNQLPLYPDCFKLEDISTTPPQKSEVKLPKI